MKQEYTIAKIAELCNTSKATVSRVLNNPEVVSEKLRNKVLEIMKQVGYTPNPFAKQLGIRGSWGIALFVFDIINPFFALMTRQIGHLTMEKGIPLTVCDTENDENKEAVYLDFLLRNKIGGIIFTEGFSISLVERAHRRVPVVLVDQHYVPESVPEVTSDNFNGSLQATEYLIQLNHDRIGYVAGPPDFPSARERLLGYRQALKNNGITYDSQLIFQGDFRYESGLQALEYFLSLRKWPTAIFCANDQMALGAFNRAQQMNISIPNDLSLVGFDAIPLFGLSPIKLTSVKQDIPMLCRNAVELLLKQIGGQPAKERIIVPTQLVVGDTCKKTTAKRKGDAVHA
jgi:DNA-binding LacI/PurR family transcriptional regulator